MKIGFIFRTNTDLWGGDILVSEQMRQGFEALGHQTRVSSSSLALSDSDFILICLSTSFDRRHILEETVSTNIPFGIMGFHEDQIGFHCLATGLQNTVEHCLQNNESIEEFCEHPFMCHYRADPMRHQHVLNFRSLKKANLWVAHSSTEAEIVRRDYPNSNILALFLPPGVVTRYKDQPDDSFLQLTGLASKSYILQIGRMECRKNQLTTILATRDLDIPLVLISTKSEPHYSIMCFEAAAKWRKAPTIFFSPILKEKTSGAAKILPIPNKIRFPPSTIASAFHHAGLYLHPSFNETPGLIFLEAAYLGTPTIASSSKWSTIHDYFYDPVLGHSNLDGRIAYTEPCDLVTIRSQIKEMFGKKYPRLDHPAIRRTEIDYAQDLLHHLQACGLA